MLIVVQYRGVVVKLVGVLVLAQVIRVIYRYGNRAVAIAAGGLSNDRGDIGPAADSDGSHSPVATLRTTRGVQAHIDPDMQV